MLGAHKGPGRSRAHREGSRSCSEARRPPHLVPKGCRSWSSPELSPNGALKPRRLQPSGSGSTSSTRPSTTVSNRRLPPLFTCACPMSVFRVALFWRVRFWLLRYIPRAHSFGEHRDNIILSLSRSTEGVIANQQPKFGGAPPPCVTARQHAGAEASAEGQGEAVLRLHGSEVSLSRPCGLRPARSHPHCATRVPPQ